jgi:ATP-binding cassette subfamily F protein uup
MTYISVEKLTKSVGQKILFEDITFSIKEGEKIALVAKNGTGKSTLLKILAGVEEQDKGDISIKNGVSIAYLSQDPDLDPQKTKYEEIFASDTPIIKAVRNYEESLQNPDNQRAMQSAYDEMVRLDAWGYEATVHEIFEKLELTGLEGKIETFSGGQKKRLALAKVLLDDAQFLILDEPTNHIDVDMINWLEEYLAGKEITLLLVTHDRHFLNAVCDHVLELHNGKMFKHKGNYDYYLDHRNTRIENENTEIDKTRKHLKKELEWVRKQPRGRLTKSSARVDAYYDTKDQLGKQHIEENVHLASTSTRMGNKVLNLHNVSKSFGDKKILDGFTYEFNKGEKIGIIGKNGVGKSTFLSLLMGEIEPDSGKIIKGDTVSFGYYSQYQTELNNNFSVIESVKEIASHIRLPDGNEISASKMLERFLFSPQQQQTQIAKLSGGERKRIALLRILMTNPNFLILDEPTNDFDLMTLAVLETFLANFKGCLIIISHDRHFMDSIVDHTFVFLGDGKIKDFPGNYSDYRNSVKSDAPKPKVAPKVEQSADKETKKQANDLYREIQKLEKKRTKITEEMSFAANDYQELGKLGKELKALDLEIEEMNEEWLSLSA